MLRHPVLEAAIGGTTVDKRPSEFRLMTQAGFHSVAARLLYPADSGIGKAGDAIRNCARVHFLFRGKTGKYDILEISQRRGYLWTQKNGKNS
jgi:hypothetical protein